jgi:hypothetical protein
MLRRLDALKEDHTRLRALIGQCEASPPGGLQAALLRLQDAMGPHITAKEDLYDMAVLATRAAGDTTGLSLLNIFRTNLSVTSSAVQRFLRAPEPDPARLQQRLRSVTGALRSLLDTEEKVIFPLAARHAAHSGARGTK